MLKAIVYVLAGAASYGTLATLVKLAYRGGYNTGEVVLSQYLIGLLFCLAWVLLDHKKRGAALRAGFRTPVALITGGTCYGLTGYCYYLALQHISASVAVVLLMQSIWMGVLWEGVEQRKLPSVANFVAIAIILFGTILATHALSAPLLLNTKGVLWGLTSALLYTISLRVAKADVLSENAMVKSLFILIGATAAILVVSVPVIRNGIDYSIFRTWGIPLALFGTVIPPLVLNKGLPKTGMGLGSVLISVEIPISVLAASIILHEAVEPTQWAGVICIVCAVAFINLKKLRTDLRLAPRL